MSCVPWPTISNIWNTPVEYVFIQQWISMSKICHLNIFEYISYNHQQHTRHIKCNSKVKHPKPVYGNSGYCTLVQKKYKHKNRFGKSTKLLCDLVSSMKKIYCHKQQSDTWHIFCSHGLLLVVLRCIWPHLHMSGNIVCAVIHGKWYPMRYHGMDEIAPNTKRHIVISYPQSNKLKYSKNIVCPNQFQLQRFLKNLPAKSLADRRGFESQVWELCQYPGCRCPGAARMQYISSHDIDFIR